MSFEAIEADDDNEEQDNVIIIALLTGTSVEELERQSQARKRAEEFWSDKVWGIHPDDDIYGNVCHPSNQKPERV